MPGTFGVVELDGYDLIGDVHGHADKLVLLLTRMGYEERNGAWQHEKRQAIFVGDLVDRGPGQIETVRIARAMVERGSALVVAGNHEFNAIAWHRGLREKSDKNRSQHEGFLNEVGAGSIDHELLIDWFLTLPLWLDLGDLRVVHACWDSNSIDVISHQTGPRNSLTEELVVAASQNESAEWIAIENLLKGPEVVLAPHPPYLDKGGHERKYARWKWGDPAAVSLRAGALIPRGTTTALGAVYPELPDDILEEPPVAAYRDTVPVFFGHYWFTGTPQPESDYAACVDYSAGKGGPLVAYRWSGEPRLVAEGFVST